MDKEKVLELARESELARQLSMEVPFVVDRLERFAALIEREVCGGMSRDKVFELMLAAGCSKYCDPKHPELEGFIVNDSVLDRIVALIEREVRGDAEPVAWMYEWDGKKHLTFTDQRPIEQSHPHFNKSTPLYTHPTPAVDGEPVAWSVFDKRTKKHWYTNESKYEAQHYAKEYAHHEPDNTLSMIAVPLYTHPAPAVDAEPVACIATNGALMWLKRPEALYSKPVPLFMQPAPDVVMQPLTHDELRQCAAAMDANPLADGWRKLVRFARAIERAHGIGGSE